MVSVGDEKCETQRLLHLLPLQKLIETTIVADAIECLFLTVSYTIR